MTVGQIGFDPVIGFSGTNSVFYPGLSTEEVFKKSLGQGHLELGPDDVRPLRQKADDIGWLLGTLFTLQVIPSANDGVYQILAGHMDSVMRQSKKIIGTALACQLAGKTRNNCLSNRRGTHRSRVDSYRKSTLDRKTACCQRRSCDITNNSQRTSSTGNDIAATSRNSR